MALIVLTALMNLLFDHLVTRYENTAPRDPGSPYLQGSTPRELGPEEAPGAVLFVHGFIGAQSNFNDLPDQVAAAGWFARSMRLPGHGTSPRDLERTTADELIAGVVSEIRTLREGFPTVVVVGHSMGGALSVIAAAREPVDGLILCSPYFELTWSGVFGIPAGRLLESLSPILRWMPARPNGGPVALKENRKFIDYYRWIPVQGALTAWDVGRQARSPEVCGGIEVPLLAIHSRNDTVTSPDATARVLPRFGSETREIIWLEESDHVIFWDYEHEIVASAVLAFLKEVEMP